MRDVTRVLFSNNDCQARFGSPRPHAEAVQLFNSLPEDDKQAARKGQLKLYQVLEYTFHCLHTMQPAFSAHMCIMHFCQQTLHCDAFRSLLHHSAMIKNLLVPHLLCCLVLYHKQAVAVRRMLGRTPHGLMSTACSGCTFRATRSCLGTLLSRLKPRSAASNVQPQH